MDDRVTNRRYPPCSPAVATEDRTAGQIDWSTLELLQGAFDGINKTNVSGDDDVM